MSHHNSYQDYLLYHLRFTPGTPVYVYNPAGKTFDFYGREESQFGIPSGEAIQKIMDYVKVGGSVYVFTEGSQDADEAITLVESLR